jgi:hypothetical protein
VLEFAGTVTFCVTEPVVHGFVKGRPEIPVGVTENLHEVALPPTVADSVTLPPVDGSAFGDAANAVTVGAADAGPTTIRNTNPASRDTWQSLRQTSLADMCLPPCRSWKRRNP